MAQRHPVDALLDDTEARWRAVCGRYPYGGPLGQWVYVPEKCRRRREATQGHQAQQGQQAHQGQQAPQQAPQQQQQQPQQAQQGQQGQQAPQQAQQQAQANALLQEQVQLLDTEIARLETDPSLNTLPDIDVPHISGRVRPYMERQLQEQMLVARFIPFATEHMLTNTRRTRDPGQRYKAAKRAWRQAGNRPMPRQHLYIEHAVFTQLRQVYQAMLGTLRMAGGGARRVTKRRQ